VHFRQNSPALQDETERRLNRDHENPIRAGQGTLPGIDASGLPLRACSPASYVGVI
jgi:hypothetical protein